MQTRSAYDAWPGIDGFTPQHVLGGGGGGTVWGCIDRCGRRVAIKIAARSAAPRMHREIAAQRRVGAPAAPQLLHRTATADGRVALVMEWLDGETLAAQLDRERERWPLDRVVDFATALAARIDEIHAAGIAHRDLKPANIWLEPDGAVRLLDFGVAWLAPELDDDWSGTRGEVVGTPYYMAPEQARGEPSGAAADIYSFGAIVFELLSGRPPFVGSDVRVAHASRRAPPVSAFAPHAAVLDEVIAACLVKRAADRPPSAGVVACRLRSQLARAAATIQARPRAHAKLSRPTALLGIPSSSVELQAVAAAAAKATGVVARASGDGFVIAFPGAVPARGVESARALAHELGVASVVHVADVGVRTSLRGVRVSGAAIDEAHTWWRTPGGITVAAARVEPAETRHRHTQDDGLHVALFGRDGELADIRRFAIAALREKGSALVTVIAEPGLGATRFLDEARAAIERVITDVRIATFDGVHRLDVAELDRIERLSAGVVLVSALPVLDQRRPTWGEHAQAHIRIELRPLPPAHMTELLRALLAPVEYIADAVLAALVQLAHGAPAHAVELVRQLRAAGAIRRSASGASYFAADELGHISPTLLAQRLAERVLAQLSPDVRCYARIAAILGDRISVERLDAICGALGYRVDVDASVALARLVAENIVVERTGDYELRSELLRDAIIETIAAGERAELHRAALACLAPKELAARARHARGAGHVEMAATALLALGDEHRRHHRDVEAEQAYSAAIADLDDGDARARALAGRAKVRCRLQRLADADADLARADAIVRDVHVRAGIRLERATVADWSERWADAARHVSEAEALMAATRDDALQSRLAMARGRAGFRAGDLRAAHQDLLTASSSSDEETATIARMLLGAVLVAAGDAHGAQAILDEVVAACEARGDHLHRCSALNDRMWVWIRRDDLDRAIVDQRAATELARTLGHPHLERCCTYNLAELLHWRGADDEALPLARRSRSLQQRFLGPSPLDALLVARIQAARDELDDVRAELDWLAATCSDLPGASAMQRCIVRLVALQSTNRDEWQRAIAMARETTVLYELHEALWFACRSACRAGDHDFARRCLDEARALTQRDAAWSARFDVLAGGNR